MWIGSALRHGGSWPIGPRLCAIHELPLYGVLGSSGLLGQELGQTLPTHQACPSEEPSSSASAPSRRPRNCTLSATTSTLLLLEPSWASQVRYCNLPSTRLGSPLLLVGGDGLAELAPRAYVEEVHFLVSGAHPVYSDAERAYRHARLSEAHLRVASEVTP